MGHLAAWELISVGEVVVAGGNAKDCSGSWTLGKVPSLCGNIIISGGVTGEWAGGRVGVGDGAEMV